MDTLVTRTDKSLDSMEHLKWKHRREITGWENFVDRMQDARQRLDTLLIKQDAFSSGCEKRTVWGEAELDNFETVPEKWQRQREHDQEAREQLRMIEQQLAAKKKEQEWVSSADVYKQTCSSRGSLTPAYDEDDEEDEEDDEEEEWLEDVEEEEEEIGEEEDELAPEVSERPEEVLTEVESSVEPVSEDLTDAAATADAEVTPEATAEEG